VRGDSLRDFYAKSLALLGLGLLAGVGALMDYWPAGVQLPVVAGLPRPAVASMALSVPTEVDLAVPAEAVRAVAPRAGRWAPAVAAVVRASDRPRVLLASTPADLRHLRGTRTLALAEPQLTAPAETLAYDADGSDVAFSMPSGSVLTTAAVYPSPGSSLSGPSDDDSNFGLVTGAFKRTGSSIVKTSMKTGASLFGMVRFVGGAVRRVLPD
jgi:hypothetical protein